MGDQWGTGIPHGGDSARSWNERAGPLPSSTARSATAATGGGNGVTSKYGLNGIANYHDDKYLKMADGEIFNTITNGHNSMMGYGANLTVRDRWAIITYVRSLQRSQTVQARRTANPSRTQMLVAAAKP